LILLLAFLATHMPSGSIAADGAASQVGHSLMEASYVSGASESRTFWKINMPLMLPGLVAGWSLLFVRYAGDFQASALLSGTTNQTAGKKIIEIYEMGSFAYLAALAMGLTAITGTVIAVVFALTRKRSSISAL
jgi:iron(III) transport system permease protein